MWLALGLLVCWAPGMLLADDATDPALSPETVKAESETEAEFETETESETETATSATPPRTASSPVTERAPIGLTGAELAEVESGTTAKPKRFILPPYVSETTDDTRFTTVLPLFYFRERRGEDATRDVGMLPFYWSHDSDGLKARVYFPFYWMFRAPSFNTDLVLQTYFRRTETGFDFGFAPLFFTGKDTEKGTRYQVLFPPLYWNFVNPEGGFRFALLYYDHRERTDFRRGFFPLYFSAKTRDRTVTTVLPPIFWHIRDDIRYTTSTVLPPIFVNTRAHGWSAGILPIFYFARDKTWSRNMVLPFYVGTQVNDDKTHVFPALLSYYRKSDKVNQGGLALFYHWYRYEGEYLQMFSPLYWRFGNTRARERAHLVPPLFYRKDTPVSDNTMVGMVYWNFHDHHKSRGFAIAPLFAFKRSLHETSWRSWVLPTFDFGKTPQGRHFWLHPLLYAGRHKDKKHFVVAPLIWRFSSPDDASTVVFPLWWRFDKRRQDRLVQVAFPLWWQFDDRKYGKKGRVLFPLYWQFHNAPEHRRTLVVPPLFFRAADDESARTGVLNTSLHRGVHDEQRFWYLNFFPFVAMGKPPVEDGARWSLLGGLLGWRRQGHTREFRFLWIPFHFDRAGTASPQDADTASPQDADTASPQDAGTTEAAADSPGAAPDAHP